jgi:uncharacterized protein (DUF58 family)
VSITGRGIGVSVAVVALWLTGRAIGVLELQLAAVAALVLVLAALIWAGLLPSGLRLDRIVTPGAIWHDGTATSRLAITNMGRATPPLRLDDSLPGALTDSGHTTLSGLRAGERHTVVTTLHGRQRGRFALGPVTVTASDPFGLVIRRRVLQAPGRLTVYPAIWQLPPGLPLGGATTTQTDRRRRTITSGDELADVREYVRGDDLRAVHWPSTAHRGRLMVRRTESNQAPSALVLLDRRADRHRGSGPTSSFELAVSAAASACHHLARRGRSVTLLDTPLARPPRAQPWEHWLEHLAAIGPDHLDVATMLRQLGDGAAGDGALVAVVTLQDAVDLRALVRAGRGFSSRAVLVVDARSFGPDRGMPTLPADEASAALRAAGWRTGVLRRGDRVDDRWRELVAGARGRPVASAGTAAGGRRP